MFWLPFELQLALGDVAVRCEVADDGLPVARLGDVSGCGGSMRQVRRKDVGNGTYVCDTGFGQWCGDGCCGTCFFKMGTGDYGNPC